MAASTIAIDVLTVVTKPIATNVATQGGMTFQTNMFSTVKTAFDVAVMRLVSIPGRRFAKELGACAVRCQNRSRRKAPVTLANVKLAIQLATRHRKLSDNMSKTRN